ncbi:MAG: hypothetical protein AAF725_26990, partial [Acidobacteriota bacterium]
RSNAAYMLSLVQGVRAHSVHNLKRFESCFNRPQGGVETLAEIPPQRRTAREEPLDFIFERRGWADRLYRDVRDVAAGEEEST